MNRAARRAWIAPSGRRSSGLTLAAILALLLTACGGGDDNDPTPVPTGTVAPAPTSAPLGSPPPTTRSGTLVGDGICQARVPSSWIDEGVGSGSTPSGHRFAVYGNRLTATATWDAAAARFTDQLEAAGAAVEAGDGWARATYPDGRGFAYRARFADRWCDVRLTARGGALPQGEAQAWPGIEASLGPAS
jgi:hypothetical protein